MGDFQGPTVNLLEGTRKKNTAPGWTSRYSIHLQGGGAGGLDFAKPTGFFEWNDEKK